MPAPHLATWRLTVEGRVRRRRAWTWDDLMDLPERIVLATVECAGNGRSFLTERQAGVQWGAGAVGNAERTGVPLRAVLDRSGLDPDGLEVLFEGADIGTEPDHPEPMPFERSPPWRRRWTPTRSWRSR